MTRTAPEFKITGWHVLWGVVAFFAIIGIVNFFFIRVALQTHSGTVGPHAYTDGLKYNQTIAAADRQAAAGWKDTMAVAATGNAIDVTLSDKDGKGLAGLKASVLLSRPATDREDVKLDLADIGGGRYSAALPSGAYGNYIASLDVSEPKASGSETVYRARRRLWVGR